MRRGKAIMMALAVMAGALVGCGGDAGAAGSGGGGVGGGGEGGGGGGTTGDAVLSGVIYDWTSNDTVGGASVCVAENAAVPCVTSIGDGTYLLERVPESGHAHLVYSLSGYLEFHWSLDLAALPSATWIVGLMPEVTAEAWGSSMGTTLSPASGMIVAKASNGDLVGTGVLGATTSLSAGDGPYYLRDDAPDSTAADTDSDGMSVFVNVPPGSYEVVYTPPSGLTCEARWGWAGSAASSIEATVVAGAITFVEMACQ
jgi:hypothetical protein